MQEWGVIPYQYFLLEALTNSVALMVGVMIIAAEAVTISTFLVVVLLSTILATANTQQTQLEGIIC